MHNDIFEKVLKFIAAKYPKAWSGLDFRSRLSPLLFCPDRLKLPIDIKAQAQRIVSAFFALRNLPERKRELSALAPSIKDPGHTSVLMSYDFHIDDQGQLRLIEINTNASMSLLVQALYEVQDLEQTFNRYSSANFLDDIVTCFRQEHAEFLASTPFDRAKRPLEFIAIVDQAPKEQRLFSEFLLYQELFQKYGLRAQIADVGDLRYHNGHLLVGDEKIDLVYNRYTDFYLQEKLSEPLLRAQIDESACLTPHPFEYRLLADKERLVELSQSEVPWLVALSDEHRDAIQRTLIRSRDLTGDSRENELWSERKNLFFKPKRSFGSKAAYRGSSISRKVFDSLDRSTYVAQEFVAAPEVFLESAQANFKFDLRFYAYRDQIQLACARVYQGQLTNSQTPGGGLAVLDFGG